LAPVSSARTLALLRRVHDRHGPQSFGRIGQTLLALSFQASGFKVTKNPVGVPDIRALHDNPARGFAVEVKTSEGGKIILQDRELKGITESALIPMVAALWFPHSDPRWLLVDGREVTAGTHEMIQLARRRPVDVGFDVNHVFRTLLADRIDTILANPQGLDDSLT
jgi:hypothetical protein